MYAIIITKIIIVGRNDFPIMIALLMLKGLNYISVLVPLMFERIV